MLLTIIRCLVRSSRQFSWNNGLFFSVRKQQLETKLSSITAASTVFTNILGTWIIFFTQIQTDYEFTKPVFGKIC